MRGKALHRPLTICGVDRRLFFLALLMGAATFNLFYSFWAGVLVFAGLYGFSLWATSRDPDMLRIVTSAPSLRPREARALRRGGCAVVRLSRILRDYSDAGGVNTMLSLWGFVGGGTFLTKAGHVGIVYSLRGIDVGGLTHAQRKALTHRMEAALRQLAERTRVYQYLVKRTVDPFVVPNCAEPVAQEGCLAVAATPRRVGVTGETR